MKPELIIVLSVAVLGIYIFVQSAISANKMKSKTTPKKEEKKDGKVEVKTVIAPKEDFAELERKALLKHEEEMKKAALESMEDERRWKEEIRKREETQKSQEQEKLEEQTLNKKIKEMEERLDQINFSSEERNFIDEVKELSPQMKAILFADILNRYGQ